MTKINREEIRGIHVDGLLYCVDHAPEGAIESAKLDQLLMQEDIGDEEWFYCDECKERIQ